MSEKNEPAATTPTGKTQECLQENLVKKMPTDVGIFLLTLAERTGLEPATPGVTGRYSNQLNYHS